MSYCFGKEKKSNGYDFTNDVFEYDFRGLGDIDFSNGEMIIKDGFETLSKMAPFKPDLYVEKEPRYELAIDLLMNTLLKRDLLAIKQEMSRFHERDVTIKILREADVLDKITQYVLEHTEKSMNDLMRAIELLIERLN